MNSSPSPASSLFDVLVVGAGHAGIEAALAASRLGCSVAVLTHNLDTIGQMSCNPAIGGLAKGHIVREIDALGGAMGLNTDATAIQFRMLNASKGPSVRAPRAQCDKTAYRARMKMVLETVPGIRLFQGDVVKLLVNGEQQVTGAVTSLDYTICARSVVICSGTFMQGLLHVGLQHITGGRMGCAPSSLSTDLAALGFQVERLKTGTSPRVNGRSIDFSVCEMQPGDAPEALFSYRSRDVLKRASERGAAGDGSRHFPGLHHLRAQRGHLLRNIHAGAAARGSSAHNGRPHGLRSFQPFHRPRRAWLSSGTA